MTAWTDNELSRIGGADELRVSSRRDDDSLRPAVIIWAVRVGDDVFIRSAYGATNPGFAGRSRVVAVTSVPVVSRRT
jgi:hypothetical protein